ncbi:MAG: SPOR domain-containing protein [Oceanococcus sp.]
MDDLVKQRLVGAIILALLALVLIPWLFGNPQDPRASIHASFTGTPVPLQRPESEREIVLSQRVESSESRTESQPTETPRRLLSPVKSTATAQPAQSKPSTQPSSKPKPKPTPSAQAWLLQLISYNNKKSADEFRARLRKDGLVAYREQVTVSGKTYFRVRLKVQGSKSQAKDLQQQLEKKYRIQAKLLPYSG